MKNLQAIIFDFDYTLADSSKGTIECINFALEKMGFSSASDDMIRQTVGLSLPDTFVKLTGYQNAAMSDMFFQLFVSRAEKIMVNQTEIFDLVPEIIRLLKSRNIALGIVSTKFRRRIETILKRDNLLGLFDVIVGGEDVSKYKPDPEGLLKATKKLEIPLSSSIYVGDSVTDAETAERAEIPFVAVLSGVTTRESFKDYPVYKIIENLYELPDLI